MFQAQGIGFTYHGAISGSRVLQKLGQAFAVRGSLFVFFSVVPKEGGCPKVTSPPIVKPSMVASEFVKLSFYLFYSFQIVLPYVFQFFVVACNSGSVYFAALVKIKLNYIRKKGKAPRNGNVFLTVFQTIMRRPLKGGTRHLFWRVTTRLFRFNRYRPVQLQRHERRRKLATRIGVLRAGDTTWPDSYAIA